MTASPSPRNVAATALRPDGPRGVRWVPGAAASAWAAAAGEAGWSVRRLDTAGTVDKSGFMAACQAAFALPAWFGRNWDALEECLRDVPAGEPHAGSDGGRGAHRDRGGVVVVWSGWEAFRRRDPTSFSTAVEVLAAVSASADPTAGTARGEGGASVAGAWLVVLVGGDSDPGVPRWPA